MGRQCSPLAGTLVRSTTSGLLASFTTIGLIQIMHCNTLKGCIYSWSIQNLFGAFCSVVSYSSKYISSQLLIQDRVGRQSGGKKRLRVRNATPGQDMILLRMESRRIDPSRSSSARFLQFCCCACPTSMKPQTKLFRLIMSARYRGTCRQLQATSGAKRKSARRPRDNHLKIESMRWI